MQGMHRPTHVRDALILHRHNGLVHGLFPRGGAELVEYILANNRNALSHAVKAEEEQWAELPIAERLYRCMDAHLQLVLPYKPRWPEAIAVCIEPSNLPYALDALQKLVDEMCFLSGIHSATLSWYQERLAVASVYVSTGKRHKLRMIFLWPTLL
jgi:ubiquinone biosynthesis protein COQ9